MSNNSENNKEDIIEKLTEIRQIQGLRQKDLALKIGRTQQQISRFELNKGSYVEVLFDIADALGYEIMLIHK